MRAMAFIAADATGWTEAETERALNRKLRFTQEGVEELEADLLMVQMLHRDREYSGDDRRICLECKHLTGKECGSPFLADNNKHMKPLRFTLQRCGGFELRGRA